MWLRICSIQMGMFDSYNPSPPLTCPGCRRVLTGWQGKDGACLLLHWQQGERFPTATDWPQDSIQNQDVDAFLKSCDTLPDNFAFYSYDCDCDRRVVAFGQCTGGIWLTTELETHVNATPEATESDREFRKRVADLERWVANDAT